MFTRISERRSTRTRRRGGVVAAATAALLGVLLASAAGPAQAATKFAQVGLAATVSGRSVAVWTKVSASPQTVVERLLVCVRSTSGAILDFPTATNVTITTAGVESYSYYPCIKTSAGWQAIGAKKSFTVGASAAAVTSSGAMPGVPAGYTRKVGENFTRAAPLGQFKAVYGSDWAGFGASSNTVATTAKDNGRYRPDQVLSTRSGISGASDGDVLDYYLHSVTLNDDDVCGPTAVSAAPLPMGWKGLTCGRFSVRYRADDVDGFKNAHLLWPESASWNDGEIDFPENEQMGTTPFWAVHIPGTYQTSYAGRLVRDASGGDAHGKVPSSSETGWHVATIDLRPGALSFEWDGKVVGRATGVGENGRTYPNHGVPTKPMVFVLQTETEVWDYANPSPSSAGHEQIDWVTVDAC